MLARAALLALIVAPAIVEGQGGYYNLDAGRPTRVEDALPAARYELEVQFVPLRMESLASGVRRWRLEPKVGYGIAPFTEIEMRAPYIVVNSPEDGVRNKSGLGGFAVGVLHAFGVERGALPVFALAAEWQAPVGSLGADVGSYSVKGIATKTFTTIRTHVNVGYGTYSVVSANDRLDAICNVPRPINAPAPPGCTPSALPPDPPCSVAPGVEAVLANRACSALSLARVEDSFDPARSVGMRWIAGIGADRAFSLISTLVSADVVAERFSGLFALTDISAEIGVRHQYTSRVVIDVGIARHFRGLLRANWLTIGAVYALPHPPLLP